MALRASPSVTPLPRKRSSNRFSLSSTGFSPAFTESAVGAIAPKSTAICESNSLHSARSWPQASDTRMEITKAPHLKGCLKVKIRKRSVRALCFCTFTVSFHPPSSPVPPPFAAAANLESIETSISDSWLPPPPLSSPLDSSSELVSSSSTAVEAALFRRNSREAGGGARWPWAGGAGAARMLRFHPSMSCFARAATAASGCSEA
mmetsp:Transcript_68986/g.224895  ORF Transcript_68986/g.224895 Transcript_68986/m.224895 type:complete len:205 (-) Transcript_68986:1667-2281(-)